MSKKNIFLFYFSLYIFSFHLCHTLVLLQKPTVIVVYKFLYIIGNIYKFIYVYFSLFYSDS